MSTPTTPEQYAAQEEKRRQALIDQDIEMHEETDEPSPFPQPHSDTSTKKKKSRP